MDLDSPAPAGWYAPGAPAKAGVAPLLNKDFKRGQLTAGAIGPQGPDGIDGDPGPQGVQGPEGPPSPATGAAGGDLTGTYPAPLVALNAIGTDEVAADSLTGADIVEGTLSGIDAATLGGSAVSGFAGVGRSGVFACGDDDHVGGGDTCGSVEVTLPRAQRVLLVVSGNAKGTAYDDASGAGSGTDLADRATGSCLLFVDDVLQVNTSVPTRLFAPLGDSRVGFGISHVTGVQPAGLRSFSVRCAESDGDIDWTGFISAVALAAD